MNCLQIKNSNNVAELLINGDIIDDSWKWMCSGEEDYSEVFPSDVLATLKEVEGQELHVHINSGGGSVFAGMAIANYLKSRTGKTIAYIDGLAASIASVIACACDEVVIPKNAFFMIHKPMCAGNGNADDLRKLADTLDVIQEGILTAYESKMHDYVTRETINKFINEETWFTGQKAVEYFKFTTTNALEAVACVGNLAQEFFNAHNLPFVAQNTPEPEETTVPGVADELAIKKAEVEVVLAMKGVNK